MIGIMVDKIGLKPMEEHTDKWEDLPISNKFPSVSSSTSFSTIDLYLTVLYFGISLFLKLRDEGDGEFGCMFIQSVCLSGLSLLFQICYFYSPYFFLIIVFGCFCGRAGAVSTN
jgi:hypothetical protein